MKVNIQGTPRTLSFTAKEFRAAGGEGEIYIVSGRAYKIYKDPAKAIPAGKIRELSTLSDPRIVKPEEVLVDARGAVVGYGMVGVPTSVPLVKLFPRGFRDANGFTPGRALKLVQAIQAGIKHAHGKGVLLVDINEMNFLAESWDLARPWFIDVDSYQTEHYPATAIMDSARDWLTAKTKGERYFSAETDWFSFGMLAFAVWIGIHPYKGTHPTIRGAGALRARAEARISALNPAVSLPASCLPVSVIPAAYRSWFHAIFEDGKRVAPPEGAVEVVVVTAPLTARVERGSGLVSLIPLREIDGRLLSYSSDWILTTTRLYVPSKGIDTGLTDPSRKLAMPERLAITPKQRRTVLVSLEAGYQASGLRKVSAIEMQRGGVERPVVSQLEADDLMILLDGRIVVRIDSQLLEGRWIEPASNSLAGSDALLRLAASPIGTAMPNATTFYANLAVQMMLGAMYISLFPESGACATVRVTELDGWRVIDGRCEKNVAQIVAERAGGYSRFVLRFDVRFSRYDLEVIDVTGSGVTDLNFAVLDTGIVAQVNEREEMELFTAREGSERKRRVIVDPAINGELALFADGARLLGSRAGKMYQMKLNG